MIVSMHLAELSPRAVGAAFRAQPEPAAVPGLHYLDVLGTARLSGDVRPSPTPGRLGFMGVWDGDDALDAFLERSPLARRFAGGWHVRLEPLRATGEWTGMPPLVDAERPVDDDEPVAVITYGRLRYRVAHRFFRASAEAAGQAITHPAFVAGTGLARPPRTVATFSLWRSSAEMRDYAYRGDSPGHVAAIKDMRRHTFHSEYLFARFRPYGATGAWDGREPLAGL